MQAVDRAIFHWINGWPDFFDPLFIGLSEGNKWWPVRIVLIGLFVYFVWNPKLRRPALLVLLVVPLANEICDVLKDTFQMLRPSAELLDAHIRVHKLTSFGTASAHSANMMGVATLFLIGARKPWGWIWLVIGVLTGISRIFIGVHYPYQVLYGWMVGAAVAVGCWYLVDGVVWGYRKVFGGGEVPEDEEVEEVEEVERDV